jgi:hypothetical protein
MLTIITPSCRQQNLHKVKESIDFDKIDKWIIVYDTSNNRSYTKLFPNNPKILELECNAGISGNPQRNLGIKSVSDGFIYFLDDDNIVHPNFWKVLSTFQPDYFYTFDQLRDSRTGHILPGNMVAVNFIDTAMFVVHRRHIGEIAWREDMYNADGYFISDIFAKHPNAHKYIKQICCYYNNL